MAYWRLLHSSKLEMEAHRRPYIEDSSLTRGPGYWGLFGSIGKAWLLVSRL